MFFFSFFFHHISVFSSYCTQFFANLLDKYNFFIVPLACVTVLHGIQGGLVTQVDTKTNFDLLYDAIQNYVLICFPHANKQILANIIWLRNNDKRSQFTSTTLQTGMEALQASFEFTYIWNTSNLSSFYQFIQNCS